jgi:hypothetical protein
MESGAVAVVVEMRAQDVLRSFFGIDENSL